MSFARGDHFQKLEKQTEFIICLGETYQAKAVCAKQASNWVCILSCSRFMYNCLYSYDFTRQMHFLFASTYFSNRFVLIV